MPESRSVSHAATASIDAVLVRWLSWIRDRKEGQALVEYSLILTLVVVIVIVILIVMGNTVKNMFSNVSGSLASP